MSDLHERLLHRLEGAAPDHEERVEAAVRAVVELHAPRPCNCREAKHVICAGCPGHAVVCATRLAIAEALGIGETP